MKLESYQNRKNQNYIKYHLQLNLTLFFMHFIYKNYLRSKTMFIYIEQNSVFLKNFLKGERTKKVSYLHLADGSVGGSCACDCLRQVYPTIVTTDVCDAVFSLCTLICESNKPLLIPYSLSRECSTCIFLNNNYGGLQKVISERRHQQETYYYKKA